MGSMTHLQTQRLFKLKCSQKNGIASKQGNLTFVKLTYSMKSSSPKREIVGYDVTVTDAETSGHKSIPQRHR